MAQARTNVSSSNEGQQFQQRRRKLLVLSELRTQRSESERWPIGRGAGFSSSQGGLADTLADPTIAPKVRHFDLSLRREALAYNFFETRNSSRKFSDEICGASLRASGRLGPGPTKSSAVGSYFKAGIPALSFSLSSRGVWVSLFGQAYRPVSDLGNSVSGLTSGETFVAGD